MDKPMNAQIATLIAMGTLMDKQIVSSNFLGVRIHKTTSASEIN